MTLDDIKAFERTLLFHGTGEPDVDVPKAMSMGGLIWLAFSSAVAQSYIPESGGETLFSPHFTGGYVDREGQRHPGTLMPSEQLQDIYEAIGVGDSYADVMFDQHGRLASFRTIRRVTEEDFVEAMARFGYVSTGNFGLSYRVKTRLGRLLRGDEKIVGKLFIFDGKDALRLLDASKGDDDLMDPTYNKIDWIKSWKAKGYDGVVIDDFLQSRQWGNFGHRSVALFSSGLRKLVWNAIPASNYDPKTIAEWNQPTPEFREYALALEKRTR